ncbi:AbrB/MazE/SpoVT family DNA-binding domain-containing protein [Candidatus Magnetominusculus dajiuhuensis]|uniref:AbrB/MazE/SpoVT family DNA-binding domain-containing protein n=1 Tax=Candidatus Magnetominusculus dajiuhuensis TaxID=3137712 RepID=UPI003B4306BB
MIKKLTKHGNSLALVIDKGVLDILNIDDKTPLNISTDGKVLIVSPVRDEARRKNFEEALEKTNNKFSRALRNLAQ